MSLRCECPPRQPPSQAPSKSFHQRTLPDLCVGFSSAQGRKLFLEAVSGPNMAIYFPLAEQFTTQSEPSFCGLATLVMCLNALGVDPERTWKSAWRWYGEEMLDCCTSLDAVKERGLSLPEFVLLAKCEGLHVLESRATGELTFEAFRDVVRSSCASTSNVVVANYSRKALGQTGDGHFSPIGGYHAESDMVLLMDVARFKYPPHWVPLRTLFESMQQIDASSGLPRGFIVLSQANETSQDADDHECMPCCKKVGNGSVKAVDAPLVVVPTFQ